MLKYFFIILLLFKPLLAEEISITLEHAVTQKERAKGLMGRFGLGKDHGMTFNYPATEKISIWMYNTLIDLDVAFLDENQMIQEIHTLKAHPQITDPQFFMKNGVTSTYPSRYALEMSNGWFKAHGINPGDQVLWEINSPHGKVIKFKP